MKYLVAELTAKAIKAWYENHQICIKLTDERELRFPVHKNRILKNAPVDKVSKIEIICDGTGLHWPELDEDLSVTGILEGRFGR
ncbi:MAG: DUF2442 domain-containing protein [Bacteroidales bacterium]|nr:DUF2442 domain-containing protein [Bacteroidales bacterium]